MLISVHKQCKNVGLRLKTQGKDSHIGRGCNRWIIFIQNLTILIASNHYNKWKKSPVTKLDPKQGTRL